MKKLISIILSLVLVVSSITSISVYATSVSDNDFENPENWVAYKDTDKTYINETNGEVATWAEFDTNSNSDYIIEGDSSLCFTNTASTFSTFVFNTEKNTNYSLKFKYYSTNETTPITRVGVIKNDYNVEFKDDQGFYVYMSDTVTLTTDDGVHSTAVRDTTKGTGTNYTANAWNEITLNFNSAENTSLSLVMRVSAANVYMDDFSLTAPVNDFENHRQWVAYNDTDKTYINETNGVVATWAEFDKNTNSDYIVEGDSSLCFTNTSATFSTFVFDTAKHTNYTLKFKYYSTKETTPITRVGVIKNDYNVEFKDDQGFYVYMNDTVTLTTTNGVHSTAVRDTTKGTGTNYTANAWNEITLNFNSAENTSLSLVVRVGDKNVYMDDFSLVASDFMEDPNAWTVYSSNSLYANKTNGTLTGDQAASVSANTNTDYISDGRTSLLFTNGATNYVAVPFDVNKNTDYVLKFKYYGTSEATPILRIGVIKNDNCIKVAPTDANKTTYYTFMNQTGSFTTTDGLFDNRKSDSSKNTTLGYTANAWSEMELAFNSYENESLTLVIYSNVNYYIDDFTLTTPAEKTIISFETNNDNELEAISGDAGASIGKLPYPTATGMNFLGWYSDRECTIPFTDTVYPTANITLYAKWSRKVITAENFDDNYDITMAYGDGVSLLGEGDFGTSGAHSGENSVKFGEKGTTSAKAYIPIYANDRQKAYVESGKTYRISLYMSVQNNGAFYIAYANDDSLTFAGTENVKWIFNSTDTGNIKDKGWQKLETTFTAAQSGYIWVGKESNTLACWIDDVVLCEATTSTISFNNDATAINGNAGDIIDSLPVLPSTFEINFAGWYTDEALTIAFDDKYYPESDIVLYAKWSTESAIVTAYNNAAALRIGANSSTGKNGLRIYNSIDIGRMENSNIVEFGSVAIRESNLVEEELILESAKAGLGIAYSEEKGISTFWDQTDDAIYFTSYLTGINPEYYGENFLIRTYAIDENGKVYYGDTVSVSVFDVAYSIDLGNSVDGNEPSTEDIAAFNAFANFGNNGYAEYTEWLTANNKTAGNISGAK